MTKRICCLRAVALAALFIITGINTFSQEPKKDVGYYLQQAAKAYKEKQYPDYLANAKAVVELRPAQPRYIYNLACAYALTGESKTAIGLLSRLANMGLVSPAETDDDLSSLRSTA
jgi:hypothetical protein